MPDAQAAAAGVVPPGTEGRRRDVRRRRLPILRPDDTAGAGLIVEGRGTCAACGGKPGEHHHPGCADHPDPTAGPEVEAVPRP